MITNTTSIKLGAVLIINNVVLNFVSRFIFFFMESHRFSHSLYDHIIHISLHTSLPALNDQISTKVLSQNQSVCNLKFFSF